MNLPYRFRIDRVHSRENRTTDVSQIDEFAVTGFVLVKSVAVVNVIGAELVDVLNNEIFMSLILRLSLCIDILVELFRLTILRNFSPSVRNSGSVGSNK